MGSTKTRRTRLSGDDGGLRTARPPFSFIRYWGKIFLGVMFLALSAATLLVFSNRLKLEHGGAADFVRLIVIGMGGVIALLGILFIRWAFAEEGGAK
jgi:hypothetical protein